MEPRYRKSDICVFCRGLVYAKHHLGLLSGDWVSVCEEHYEQLRIALRNELVREVMSP